MHTDDEVQAELWAYTLGRGDPAFVHQHAVDALGAQRADGRTTPMQLTFALVGLYLGVERGYTGRQVQQVHAALARRRLARWPTVAPPAARGTISAAHVLAAPAGPARRRDRRVVRRRLGGVRDAPRCRGRVPAGTRHGLTGGHSRSAA